jgi:hypothetical protein
LIYLLPLFSLLTLSYKHLYKSYKLNTHAKTWFPLKFLDILHIKWIQNVEDFMIPHHLLLLFLSVLGFGMMHFNSVSRLLSGYPLLFLILSFSILEIQETGSKIWKSYLIFWMSGFSLIVATFAVNFYMPF